MRFFEKLKQYFVPGESVPRGKQRIRRIQLVAKRTISRMKYLMKLGQPIGAKHSTAARQAEARADKSPRRQGVKRPTRSQVAEPLEELESIRDKLAETQDKLLRTQAELENYRKRRPPRIGRRTALRRRSIFVRDLLPIVDNHQSRDRGGREEGRRRQAARRA